MVMGRPSRSDEHLLPHEEARIEAEAREYFDGAAPKRHTKPSRSDPEALLPANAAAAAAADAPIPELAKLQELEAHSQVIYWQVFEYINFMHHIYDSSSDPFICLDYPQLYSCVN
jgi:hypothetical protein